MSTWRTLPGEQTTCGPKLPSKLVNGVSNDPLPTHFCTDYQQPAGCYDEMCRADGQPRPAWEHVIPPLERMGAEALERRQRQARQLLRENGVTFGASDSDQGTQRPWTLDPVPQVIDSGEWSRIEAGLIQRAEVLERLLADLYGERKVIAKGVLPPEAVYAHRGFLTAAAAVAPVGGRHLPLYAADIGRAPDGRFWITADRTQAPSGSGYVLENRIVLSRALPSLYQDCQVHRLAGFFRILRRSLANLAPGQVDNPRIVVLTPGPDNETYFEHAYLADYLGFSLVQGNDLTVRKGHVWLKTLDGLQPVDVILRRLDDNYADPLELRTDSLLGTPGLLHAARSGGVAIANPIGSGAVENRALLPYLPTLCRYFLGEQLILPSVATWWCGTPKEREHVIANLPSLVVRALHAGLGFSPVAGAALSTEQRGQLTRRIRANPYLYVGQEQVELSTTPVFDAGRFEPRHLMLRGFLAADQDGYTVMPGGLSRVSASADSIQFATRKGGISKDTWVLAAEPVPRVSLLPPPGQPMPIVRSGGEVPSRMADNLFWVGRYAERLDAGARLLREILGRLLDGELPTEGCFPTLLRAMTRQTGTVPGFIGEGAEQRLAEPETELRSLLFDAQRPGSLRYTLNSIITVSRGARERVSDDMWRALNSLESVIQVHARHYFELGRALEVTDRIVIAQAAISGFFSEGMSRGAGWRFVDSGRRLERATLSLALLDETLNGQTQPPTTLLETLLVVTDSIRTYRRRYRSSLHTAAMLDLLLFDESNPRSVGYQLQILQKRVMSLPRGKALPHRSAEERIILEALCALRLSDPEDLMAGASGAAGDDLPSGLKQLVQRLTERLAQLSELIGHDYFSLTEAPSQLTASQS